MSALNIALTAIERAHAEGLTATQVCALVDAARGAPWESVRDRRALVPGARDASELDRNAQAASKAGAARRRP